MYLVMWTTEIWLGQGRIQHTQTQLKWGSLCAPLYIVQLLPLFFLYFWVVIIFLGFFDFFFLFFYWYFSSLRSIKEVTTKNMSLNKWKAWPVKILEDLLKIDKKLVTTKRGSCDQFFAKIKFSEPSKSGDGRIRIFSDRFWYIERRNPSSYAKTKPVLRTDSELEDKTGIMRAKFVTAGVWWKWWGKTHELDSNMT